MCAHVVASYCFFGILTIKLNYFVANFLEQKGFSSVLFDTLFGLVLFFSVDSFLDITNAPHFLLYFFSTIILIHWWLAFKSADDAFKEEVSDSAVDLIFGIVYIILIEYIILMSRGFDYIHATGFLLALLSIDLCWALAWLYIGSWRTKDKEKIKRMETELKNLIITNVIAFSLYGILMLFGNSIHPTTYILFFIIFYLFYIFLQFKNKVIDLHIF